MPNIPKYAPNYLVSIWVRIWDYFREEAHHEEDRHHEKECDCDDEIGIVAGNCSLIIVAIEVFQSTLELCFSDVGRGGGGGSYVFLFVDVEVVVGGGPFWHNNYKI